MSKKYGVLSPKNLMRLLYDSEVYEKAIVKIVNDYAGVGADRIIGITKDDTYYILNTRTGEHRHVSLSDLREDFFSFLCKRSALVDSAVYHLSQNFKKDAAPVLGLDINYEGFERPIKITSPDDLLKSGCMTREDAEFIVQLLKTLDIETYMMFDKDAELYVFSEPAVIWQCAMKNTIVALAVYPAWLSTIINIATGSCGARWVDSKITVNDLKRLIDIFMFACKCYYGRDDEDRKADSDEVTDINETDGTNEDSTGEEPCVSFDIKPPFNVGKFRDLGYDDLQIPMKDAKGRPEVLTIPQSMNIGSVSDGYHTFDDLYRHRAVLFAALCNMKSVKAWKSHYHNDGTMYDDMFIVGIDTVCGPATYHYNNKYWGIFDCPAIEKAPEFDGHTPDDVLSRLYYEFSKETLEDVL